MKILLKRMITEHTFSPLIEVLTQYDNVYYHYSIRLTVTELTSIKEGCGIDSYIENYINNNKGKLLSQEEAIIRYPKLGSVIIPESRSKKINDIINDKTG